MDVQPTEIPDLLVLKPRVFLDDRGAFVKTYHAPTFERLGVDIPAEEFFSVSKQNVIRGMHFQIPPRAVTKCVYCLSGSILDVVLDLRKSSPTFGRSFSRELSATNGEMLLIPQGCAHGFLSLSPDALTFYQCTNVYSPNEDVGVRWDSFGFPWPVTDPTLSPRDQALPPFEEFDSPF